MTVGIGLLVALAWIAPEIRNRFDETRNLSYREEAERAVNLSERYFSDKRYVLELINNARSAEGLVPVSLGGNPAAQSHAEVLRDACVLSHWGRTASSPMHDTAWLADTRPTLRTCLAPWPVVHLTNMRIFEKACGIVWKG